MTTSQTRKRGLVTISPYPVSDLSPEIPPRPRRSKIAPKGVTNVRWLKFLGSRLCALISLLSQWRWQFICAVPYDQAALGPCRGIRAHPCHLLYRLCMRRLSRSISLERGTSTMDDGLVAGRDDNYLKEQPDDPEPLIKSRYWQCEDWRVMSIVKVIRNQYEHKKS